VDKWQAIHFKKENEMKFTCEFIAKLIVNIYNDVKGE